MAKNNIVLKKDVILFLQDQKDSSADLIIADPPYNICIDKWDRFKSQKHYLSFMFKWIDLAIKKLKDGGSLYIFNNQINSAIILNYLKDKLTFNNWITWYKKDGFHPTKCRYVNNQETILFFSKGKPSTFNYDQIRMPYLSIKRFNSGKGITGKNGKPWVPNSNGKLCTDVWEFSSERHSTKKNGRISIPSHPTIKPWKIIERIVKASSNKNDIIFDLFSGSGQTTFVCKKLSRISIGCEKDTKYFLKIKKILGGKNE